MTVEIVSLVPAGGAPSEAPTGLWGGGESPFQALFGEALAAGATAGGEDRPAAPVVDPGPGFGEVGMSTAAPWFPHGWAFPPVPPPQGRLDGSSNAAGPAGERPAETLGAEPPGAAAPSVETSPPLAPPRPLTPGGPVPRAEGEVAAAATALPGPGPRGTRETAAPAAPEPAKVVRVSAAPTAEAGRPERPELPRPSVRAEQPGPPPGAGAEPVVTVGAASGAPEATGANPVPETGSKIGPRATVGADDGLPARAEQGSGSATPAGPGPRAEAATGAGPAPEAGRSAWAGALRAVGAGSEAQLESEPQVGVAGAGSQGEGVAGGERASLGQAERLWGYWLRCGRAEGTAPGAEPGAAAPTSSAADPVLAPQVVEAAEAARPAAGGRAGEVSLVIVGP
ncbi:MAG: hypothetical protein ACYDA8_18715, partial [Deferrisomatales bacterium]